MADRIIQTFVTFIPRRIIRNGIHCVTSTKPLGTGLEHCLSLVSWLRKLFTPPRKHERGCAFKTFVCRILGGHWTVHFQPPAHRVCCISFNFFLSAANARNQKTVTSCNFFFCCKSCIYANQKISRLTARKRLHDVTIFCHPRLPRKLKNYTTLPQTKNYQFY